MKPNPPISNRFFGKTPTKPSVLSTSTLFSSTDSSIPLFSPQRDFETLVTLPNQHPHNPLTSPTSHAPTLSAAQVFAAVTSQADQLAHAICIQTEPIHNHAVSRSHTNLPPIASVDPSSLLFTTPSTSSTSFTPSLPMSSLLPTGIAALQQHEQTLAQIEQEDIQLLRRTREQQQHHHRTMNLVLEALRQRKEAAYTALQAVEEACKRACMLLEAGVFLMRCERGGVLVDTAAAATYSGDSAVVCQGISASEKERLEFYVIPKDMWMHAPRISGKHALTVCENLRTNYDAAAQSVAACAARVVSTLEKLASECSIGPIIRGEDGEQYVVANMGREIQERVAQIEHMGHANVDAMYGTGDRDAGEGNIDAVNNTDLSLYSGDISRLLPNVKKMITNNSVVNCVSSLLSNLHGQQLCLQLRGTSGILDTVVHWATGSIDTAAAAAIVKALRGGGEADAVALLVAVCEGMEGVLEAMEQQTVVLVDEEGRNIWMRCYRAGKILVEFLKEQLSEFSADADTSAKEKAAASVPKVVRRTGLEEAMRVKRIRQVCEIIMEYGLQMDIDQHIRTLFGKEQVPENFQIPKMDSGLVSKQKKVIERKTTAIFNKIAANLRSIADGVRRISALWHELSSTGISMSGVTVQGIPAVLYSMFFLAEKLTDTTVDLPATIFCHAYLASYLSLLHPIFHDLFLASLHERCVWCMPLLVDRVKCANNIQYKLQIGFRKSLEDEKVLETSEIYLNRQQNSVSLFLAYTQVDTTPVEASLTSMVLPLPLYQWLDAARVAYNSTIPTHHTSNSTQAPDASSPTPLEPITFTDGTVASMTQHTPPPAPTGAFRVALGWVWAAKVLNYKQPTLATPLLLQLMLEFAAARLSEAYGPQYDKLCTLLEKKVLPWLQQQPQELIGADTGKAAMVLIGKYLSDAREKARHISGNSGKYMFERHSFGILPMDQESSAGPEYVLESDKSGKS